MKNILQALPLVTVVAVPVVLVLETAGIHLPSGLNLQSALNVCIASLVSLIAFSDYTQARQSLARLTPATAKAAHPLAA